MQLHTEQRRTEAAERGRELQKLHKQLDRYRSKTYKQFRKLCKTAPADSLNVSDSDSEQQSQLQAQYTQLQSQYSQLQILCTRLQTQHTQLAAEHEQLQSQS